jgi:hypothetical protein
MALSCIRCYCVLAALVPTVSSCNVGQIRSFLIGFCGRITKMGRGLDLDISRQYDYRKVENNSRHCHNRFSTLRMRSLNWYLQ